MIEKAGVDLSLLDLEELRALARDLGDEIARQQDEAEREARLQIRALAERCGLSAEDFAAAADVPKYHSGTSPDFTWSGRGRKPEWVLRHLAGGGALDDLLIER